MISQKWKTWKNKIISCLMVPGMGDILTRLDAVGSAHAAVLLFCCCWQDVVIPPPVTAQLSKLALSDDHFSQPVGIRSPR